MTYGVLDICQYVKLLSPENSMRIVLCYRTDIHYVANGLGHTS